MKKSHLIIIGLVLIGCAGIVYQVVQKEAGGGSEKPGEVSQAENDKGQDDKGAKPVVSGKEAEGAKGEAGHPQAALEAATHTTEDGKEGEVKSAQVKDGAKQEGDQSAQAKGEKVAGTFREKAIAVMRARRSAREAVKEEVKPVQIKQDVEGGGQADPNALIDPLDQLEAVNLKDITLQSLLGKIARWTGKVIIPDEEAGKQKLTIVSDKKIPRREVLKVIYAALREKGFVAEEQNGVLYFKPLDKARLQLVPSLSPDEPLAQIEDKSKVVQKFFKVRIYDPIQLLDIVKPLVSKKDGFVSADESTRMLVVIDTVSNLMRIEEIIKQLDVPEAEQMVTEVFEIGEGDPVEIVQLLRILLSGESGASSGSSSSRSRSSRSSSSRSVSSVVMSFSKHPVLLIPEPNRKWIIARAAPNDMKVIAEWIGKLDLEQQVELDHEIVSVQYADVEELADQLNEAIREMPGIALRANVLVKALEDSKQIMIFGNAKNRAMIKQFILEIDIPPDMFITKHFKIKHADPEKIMEDIETLFKETAGSTDTNQYRYYYYSRSSQPRRPSSNMVRAIAFPALKQVTVIASEENMVKVGKQIAEWDQPIDVDAVKPMIVTLRNSDAVQLANLLSRLFTEEDDSGSGLPWWWFGGSSPEEKRKIVGPLYGQLAFEPVPDTKKIVVISKVPEAYAVVRKLIEELDEQDIAELPMTVILKYADAEDLCDQLNALLNEPGTMATIRRSQRGLSAYDQDQQTGQGRSSSNNNQNQNQQQNQANMITPWWTQQRSTVDEMPTSNLIGKVRFVPVARSKAILVLAPPEYRESLREMIEELDKPGKQVMIKAVIIEVNRENLQDVGVKLSSNPAAFGALGENVIATLTQLALGRTIDRDSGKLTGDVMFGVNVTAVVDFLVREAGARVLNEPTLWTKDNEEASFFKGGSIPFLVQSQTSVEGASITTNVEYRPVGVTLRVRPNITPEKAVNMTVHLIISQVRPDLINGNIATSEVNATTHMTIKDGETLLMGGILFQDDSETVLKLPLLGDIPFIGELFTHRSTTQTNNEMMVFITPYVMDEESSDEAEAELEGAIDRMDSAREQLGEGSRP